MMRKDRLTLDPTGDTPERASKDGEAARRALLVRLELLHQRRHVWNDEDAQAEPSGEELGGDGGERRRPPGPAQRRESQRFHQKTSRHGETRAQTPRETRGPRGAGR